MTPNELSKIISNQPYPLLFATISGAHLYGFPSPDSDYDLRGSHILPLREVVGLNPCRETIELSQKQNSLEIDLVTYDIKQFFSLLLKRNGNVLEQLYSPLVLQTTPEHEELKQIATKCITRYHARHYLGFASTQWKLFEKEEPKKIKPLLYIYRVLLTGIYLMRTGIIEANLVKLNEEFKLTYLPDLIAQKIEGEEKIAISAPDVSFYQLEYVRLRDELERAFEESVLPEKITAQPALNDLLIGIRMKKN